MGIGLGRVRLGTAIMVGGGLAGALAVAELTVSPARAQVVCQGGLSGGAASGNGAVATGFGGTACGAAANAGAGVAATAIGSNATAAGDSATSLGGAAGQNNGTTAGITSVGALANSRGGAGAYSTAIGATPFSASSTVATSGGDYSVAIGGGDNVGATPATTSGLGAIAIGGSSNASGASSVAVGFGSQSGVLGINSGVTALGAGATGVGQNNATAVGSGAVATATNAVAIGTGSVGRQRRRRAPRHQCGRRYRADRRGQCRPALQRRHRLQAQIGGLQDQIRDNQREARRGVAAAMSMTPAPMPSKAGRTSWAMNTSTFRGEFGVGGSLAYRLDTNVPVALTAGYAYGGGDNHGARVGLAGGF